MLGNKDEKALRLKKIFEDKIEEWCNEIQYYNDVCLKLEKENQNDGITLYKYRENKGKIATYKRIIDDLTPELRTYRVVLQIINNVLETD